MIRSKSAIVALLALVVLAAQSRDAAAVTPVFTCQSLGPGSYQLMSDVTAPNGSDCFVLSSDNITLNLAGQTIKGTGGGTAITIVPNIGIQNISILRGTITGFANGIDLASAGSAITVQIQSMCIYGVSNTGIRISNTAIVGNNIVHADGTGIIAVGCSNNFIQNVSIGTLLGNSVSNCNNKVDNLGF